MTLPGRSPLFPNTFADEAFLLVRDVLGEKIHLAFSEFQGPDDPSPAKGHFASILVREGDAWKECMLAYNVAPAPA
jgi:hypothetical protein